MFDRFSDRSRRVMGLARLEAQKLNHEYIGTEHILLGMLGEDACVANSVLRNLDVEPGAVRRALEARLERGTGMVTMGQIPFTPQAKRVLERSYEEAAGLGHNYIGTEHLLLGSLREEHGLAGQVLRELHLDLADAREEVLQVLGADPPHRGEGTSLRLRQRNLSVRLDGIDDERVPEASRRAVSEATRQFDLVRAPDGLADIVITFAPEESSERMFRAGFAAAWRSRIIVLLPAGAALPSALAKHAAGVRLDDSLRASLDALLAPLRPSS